MPSTDPSQPAYLTTREVAELLRVKERKVYDLAAAGEIPHRRITGKLLFPSAEIQGWIEGGAGAAPNERPAVLTGSHDPLLDWAVRESGSDLALLTNGSTSGLDAFSAGQAAVTGLHIPAENGWNIEAVSARNLRDCVLIGWAVRARGLILSAAARDEIHGFAQLKGRRVAMRQPGAGAAALFQMLLARAGLGPGDIEPSAGLARTEGDAAAAVAAGEADATLGIKAMARRYGLGFVPLVEESFDLLADRRAYFTPPVQRLLAFSRTPVFAEKAAALGGYDVSASGQVRWVSP